MYQLAKIIDSLFSFIYLLLVIRILLSWIPHNPYNQIVQFLYTVTDPILKPFRDMIPPIAGMDISPMIAFMALGIVKNLIFQIFF